MMLQTSQAQTARRFCQAACMGRWEPKVGLKSCIVPWSPSISHMASEVLAFSAGLVEKPVRFLHTIRPIDPSVWTCMFSVPAFIRSMVCLMFPIESDNRPRP